MTTINFNKIKTEDGKGSGYPENYPLVLQSFEVPAAWHKIVSRTDILLQGVTNDFAVKLLEDIGIFLYHLSTAKRADGYLVAIVTFVKLRTNSSILYNVHVDTLISHFEKVFMGFRLQSEPNIFSELRMYLDKYDDVKNLPIFKKLYKFLMYAMSLSLFDKIGLSLENLRFSKLEQEAVRKQYHMGTDFIHSMLDTLTFLCERGVQCMRTGTMEPIYHSASRYEEWFLKAMELKQNSVFLTNPEPHGLNRFEYLAELSDSIEKGEAIYSYVNKVGSFEKKTVLHILNDLILIKKTELTKRAAQKSRKAPFSVLLYGGSSVGKSTFTEILYYHYGKIFGLPISAEYKYTRNPVDPFWVNFNSTQWCIQLDDIAFMSPDIAKGGGDPSLMEMIQVINRVPFVPTQADLADKGRTPVQSRLVIATTNTEHLNAFAYFSCPLAVQRRLPFIIEIIPKEEYAKHKCMLDGNLVPVIVDGFYPNYWQIQVHKVVPKIADGQTGTNASKLVTIGIYEDINQFLVWYSKEARAFEDLEDKASLCSTKMAEIVVCTECYFVANLCKCNKTIPQSDEETTSSEEEIVVPLVSDRFPEPRPNMTLERATILYDQANEASLYEDYLVVIDDPSIRTSNYIIDQEGWLYFLTSMFDLFILWIYFYCPLGTFIAAIFWRITGFHDRIVTRILDGRTYRYIFRFMGERRHQQIGKYHFLGAVVVSITAGYGIYKTVSILYRNIFSKKHETQTSEEIDECEKREYEELAIDQAYYDEIGQKAVAEYKEKMLLQGITMSLAGVEALNPRTAMKPEGSTLSAVTDTGIGRAPTCAVEERNNVWYKNDYQTTTFDVSPMTTSYKAFPIETVRDMIFKNCVFFRSRYVRDDAGFSKPVRGVCIAGHIYMCNNHSLPTLENFELSITSGCSKDGVNSNITILISQSDIFRSETKDLAFIKIRHLPPKKNIINLFCKETLRGGFKGLYVSRGEGGDMLTNSVSNIKRIPQYECDELSTCTDSWFGIAKEPTINGDCGSILLANSGYGPIILGIHYLGHQQSNKVGAVVVTSAELEEAVSHFNLIMVEAGEPLLSAQSAPRELGSLHKKSPIRFCPQGTANVYGSFTGFRPKCKSEVQPSFIAKALLKRRYRHKFTKPMMAGWKPWYNALKDMVAPITHFDTKRLEDCKQQMIEDILAGLSKEDLDQVHVYDDNTAINGAVGVAYVDKMNRNTSAGNPWKKSKKYFMKHKEFGNLTGDEVEFNAEIMDRVKKCIDTYKSGRRYVPVHCANLKDEPVKEAKAESGDTRVFTGCPADWSVVVRKYFLSVVRLIQNKRFLFESAPGTVAQSLEWQEIHEYLVQHGVDQLIAGDFKKFDKKMASIIILAAFDILIAVCKAAGYTPEDLLVCQGIAEDTAFPVIDFNGDLIEFFGSNPSGHPLTVIINGLANSLYMRYVFSLLSPDGVCKLFKLLVALMTYGDDNALGVSKKAPWFNHTAIQKVLADVGIGYTMADKTAESVPFIHIDEVSFLKRTWRWDEDVKAMLCPLDHESIEKMLMVNVKSKSITEEEQAIAVIGSAIREYFYYGKSVFELRRSMMKEVIEECDLDAYVNESTLPTWEELKDQFWFASEHVTLGKFKPQSIEEMGFSYKVHKNQNIRSYYSYCTDTSIVEALHSVRMGNMINTPERSSKSLFRLVGGVSTKMFQQCYFGKAAILASISPTETIKTNVVATTIKNARWSKRARRLRKQEREAASLRLALSEKELDQIDDYVLDTEFKAQSQEEQEITQLKNLPDNLLGALVKKTWVDGQYIKFKRMLALELRREKSVDVHLWTPEEMVALMHELEINLHNEHVALKPQSQEEASHLPDVSAASIDIVTGQEISTLHFLGDDIKEHVSYNPIQDNSFYQDCTAGTDLGEFLSRPVLIQTMDWTLSGLSSVDIAPWYLFFNDTRIKKKLDNYAFMSCNLHIKIVVNASPFYYGAAIASYHPLPTFNPVAYSGTSANTAYARTQLPHVWIYPQMCAGGELTLPFFYYKNWFELTDGTELTNMGTLSVAALSNLYSANGAATGSATIQIYAWASDVKLAGPTVKLALQSREEPDEYGNGSISLPASAIARAMEPFKSLPILGRFATATQLGASAVSKIASLFGFTNVPVIADVQPLKNVPFHALSSTQIGEPIDKLTLDPKNELSIDPRTVGLKPVDELDLSYLLQKESYVTAFSWDTSDVIDDLLFSTTVLPLMHSRASIAGSGSSFGVDSTPMGHLQFLFGNWRGDIIFRFRAICTKYHKGRVRVTWDPTGNIITDATSTTVAFTKVIDLAVDTNFEIRVPYMQALPWLKTWSNFGGSSWWKTSSFAFEHDPAYTNGTLTMRVLTAISGPTATASVSFLVFARGADNLELANPVDLPLNASPFTPQSQEEPIGVQHCVAGKSNPEVPERYLINFGEAVTTLRTLLRRAVMVDSMEFHNYGDTTALIQNLNVFQTKFPRAYGYDTNGLNSAKGIKTGTTGTDFPFNFSNNTPFVWVSSCYVGGRGSMMWHYNASCQGSNTLPLTTTKVIRRTSPITALISNAVSATSGSDNVMQLYLRNNTVSGARGLALTNQITQTGLAAVLPQYSNRRMVSMNPLYFDKGTSLDGSADEVFSWNAVAIPTRANNAMRDIYLQRYSRIGTDFNLFFFRYVPTMYTYGTTIVPT